MIGLIIIGDEILSGKRQDKHMPKALELLKKYHTHLDFVHYLADDPAELITFFKHSFEKYGEGEHLIISCGGIGATPDDHTREVVAHALNLPLEMNDFSKNCIIKRITQMQAEGKAPLDLNHPDNQMRFEMARWAKGAAPIENPYNGIPGFSIHNHYFLPGFPVMAWPMMELIFEKMAQQQFFWQENTHAFYALEMPESQLSAMLFELESEAEKNISQNVNQFNPIKNLKTFSLPSFGIQSEADLTQLQAWQKRPHIEIGIKFLAKTIHTPAWVEQILQQLKEKIKQAGYHIIEVNE